MIVDFHTHIFPPGLIAERERLVRDEPVFGLLYAEPKSKLATAEDLLASMDAAGVDVSVALGFAWQDEATCRRHNDYLLEAANGSRGRIVPFCTLPLAAGVAAVESELRRCMAAGARGFGELRPDNSGFELGGPAGDGLAALAAATGATLLFHVSEPVGHVYAGKEGLALGSFYQFAAAHPEVTCVGAHWGGGLPFYPMPEVSRQFEGNLYVDTAATSLLYDDAVYGAIARRPVSERILFGSDYPLLGQARSRSRIEESGLDAGAIEAILGGNASRLLELT